jgi:hypothetical protein
MWNKHKTLTMTLFFFFFASWYGILALKFSFHTSTKGMSVCGLIHVWHMFIRHKTKQKKLIPLWAKFMNTNIIICTHFLLDFHIGLGFAIFYMTSIAIKILSQLNFQFSKGDINVQMSISFLLFLKIWVKTWLNRHPKWVEIEVST